MRTLVATALLSLVPGAVLAAGHSDASTFPNTCSNTSFQYGADGGAEIHATCLRADGSPNQTSIAMPAIANNNGRLEMSGDVASFQKSCGNIMLETNIDGVTLTANCRTEAGTFEETSINVPGIGNSDGTLSN
jgi:hypothetical protein